MKGFLAFLFLVMLSLCGIITTVDIYNRIQFDKYCGGYLKLAADANNVELAKDRLDRALDYIEKEGYTEGTTAVLWETPEYSVTEWYKNLEAARANLHTFPANAGETEVGVALVKLRETLLDHGSNGDHVTVPSSIHLFPNNALWFFFFRPLQVISGLLAIFLLVTGVPALLEP